MKFHQKSHRITLAKLGLQQHNTWFTYTKSRKCIEHCFRKGYMFPKIHNYYVSFFDSRKVHWKRHSGVIFFTESKAYRKQQC